MSDTVHPLLSRDAVTARGFLARLARDGQAVASRRRILAHGRTLTALERLGLIEIAEHHDGDAVPARHVVARITDKGRTEIASWAEPPLDPSPLWSET